MLFRSNINTFYLNLSLSKDDLNTRIFNQNTVDLLISDFFPITNSSSTFFVVKSNTILSKLGSNYFNLELTFFRKVYLKLYYLLFSFVLYFQAFKIFFKNLLVRFLFVTK